MFYEHETQPPPRTNSEIEAIGFVQSSNGFHLRQRQGSNLWDPLQDGDTIYPDDQIKTGSQGELTLALPSTGKALDIESDSRVQLRAGEKFIAAVTFDGLFSALPRSDKPTRQLRMTDGDQATVHATPSEARSYIKDGKNPLREVDPKTERLPSFQNIAWQAPSTLADSDLNLELPVGAKLKWAGEHPDWSIQFEWGPARRKLSQKKLFPSKDHEAHVVLPIGKNFWRWSVVNTKTNEVLFTAPASRMVVLPLIPPAIQHPVDGDVVRGQKATDPVALRWLAEKRFMSYEIQVSEDPNMAKPIASAKNITKGLFTFNPDHYGTYYWQAAGFEEGRKEAIRTKVHGFRLLPKEIEKIQLTWMTPEGSKQTFLGSEPKLALKWSTPSTGNYTYNLKVRPIDGELGRPIEKSLNTTEISLPVERAGTYQALVEAFNKDGDQVGATTPLQVSINLQPLLKPPTLLTNNETATSSGQVNLRWSHIDGAKEYQIEIRSPDGRVYNQVAPTTEIELKKLLPGSYEFTINTVDKFGRPSERSPAGHFSVPETSSLKGPKIHKVDVE